MTHPLKQSLTRLESASHRLEQAFEQQRRFTADASHELRTPLTRIKGSASLALSSSRTPAEYCKALRVVDQAADVMNRLVQDLLLLARADADQLRLEQEPVLVASLLEHAADAPQVGPHVSVHVDLPDRSLAVLGHSDSLLRLLTNLIENALRHTPEEGEI